MTSPETIPSPHHSPGSSCFFLYIFLTFVSLSPSLRRHPNSVRGRTGDGADATCRVRVVQSRFVQPLLWDGGEKKRGGGQTIDAGHVAPSGGEILQEVEMKRVL